MSLDGKTGAVRSSPTVADVDQDGRQEVLVSIAWNVAILSADGTRQQYPTPTSYSVFASPAVGDTDGNGRIEVWIGGSSYGSDDRGYLWRFESDIPGYGKLEWPMFHRDAQHSGSYR